MKRIGIFSFFDIAGIVDDYVIYYLKEMNKVLEDIYFVSNGKLSQESKVKVEPYIRHIIERENKGFDAGAYKDVISAFESEIWDDADELVLFNDTVFGPFYKIEDIFLDMTNRHVDFWGMTRHEKAIAWREPVAACVQSYFLCVSSRMLHSKDFMDFWRSIPSDMPTLQDVVINFEFKFTDFFEKRGYTWDVYSDYSEIESEIPEFNYSPTYYGNYELVKYKGYPFIKRKNLIFRDGFKLCNGEDIVKCLGYVRDNNLYDVRLIWENALRIYDPQDIYAACHFLHISKATSKKPMTTSLKARLFALIRSEAAWDEVSERIEECVGAFSSVCLCVSYNMRELANKKFGLHQNVGKIEIISVNESAEFFFDRLAQTDDDLVCFFSGDYIDGKAESKISYKSAAYKDLDCILPYKCVGDIIGFFEKEQFLGALFAPDSYIGGHIMHHGGYQTAEESKRLECFCRDMGILTVKKNKRRISNSESFWCRKNILMFLKEHYDRRKDRLLCTDDMKLFIKSIPYITQEMGMFSGITMSEDEARIEYVNMREMLTSLLDTYRDNRRMEQFADIVNWKLPSAKQLTDFCEFCGTVYIYGAGDYGRRVYSAIHEKCEIKAFIVSQKGNNVQEYMGIPVIGKDEMKCNSTEGVVIAVSEEKQEEIRRELKRMNIRRVFRV